MPDNKPNEKHRGSKFTIIHCKGALDSFTEALDHVSRNKHQSFTHGMIQQINRLSDGQRMSKENFRQEGNLPKRKGQQKEKNFNALKRKPIRGYCWLSECKENTYFISHYVFKNYDKLQNSDTNKVAANWHRIEENGDEC